MILLYSRSLRQPRNSCVVIFHLIFCDRENKPTRFYKSIPSLLASRQASKGGGTTVLYKFQFRAHDQLDTAHEAVAVGVARASLSVWARDCQSEETAQLSAWASQQHCGPAEASAAVTAHGQG